MNNLPCNASDLQMRTSTTPVWIALCTVLDKFTGCAAVVIWTLNGADICARALWKADIRIDDGFTISAFAGVTTKDTTTFKMEIVCLSANQNTRIVGVSLRKIHNLWHPSLGQLPEVHCRIIDLLCSFRCGAVVADQHNPKWLAASGIGRILVTLHYLRLSWHIGALRRSQELNPGTCSSMTER